MDEVVWKSQEVTEVDGHGENSDGRRFDLGCGDRNDEPRGSLMWLHEFENPEK